MSSDESSEPSLASGTFDEEVFTRQYTVLEALGQGSTGKVMLAQHRLTGATVAVKALPKETWSKPSQDEVDILKMLKHPNIISLLQVIETSSNTYMIMEVAEGEELFSRIQKAGYLKEDEARNAFIQILSAVGYCHEEGVAHRDLKPDNIIINPNGKVKVIDFGLGARFRPGQMLESLCGVPNFRPPEVFLGLPYDGRKVDMWSLGVILYYMLAGRFPFEGTMSELRGNVLKGKYDIPYHLSKDVRNLISQLLSENPRKRPTVWNVMIHPWLRKGDIMFTVHISEEISYFLTDYKIIRALSSIGFDQEYVLQSLRERDFNEAMAAYQLLRRQAGQDNSRRVHRTFDNPGPPFPSLEDPDSFSLSHRMRASEHASQTRVSPTIHVSDLPKKAPSQKNDSQGGFTVPSIHLKNTEDSSIPAVPKSETEHIKGQSRTSTSGSLQPRGWARWRRRIRACIRQLCCCLATQKSRVKVHPQKCGVPADGKR